MVKERKKERKTARHACSERKEEGERKGE